MIGHFVGVCKDLKGHEGAMSAQETLQELEDGVEAVESGLEHLFRPELLCSMCLPCKRRLEV